MDEAARIGGAMEDPLTEMYELGREEATKEKEEECKQVEEDAYNKGVDKGYNEGYGEAMKEFRVPDL